VDKKQGLDIKSVTATHTARSPEGFKVVSNMGLRGLDRAGKG
jgi:hypothetical protein